MGFLGCHWGYGRKSLSEWRALLCGVRYGAALRCWSLAGKTVLRQTKYCGVGSEGDGAVGGLGLRQKGLAAL